MSDYIRKNRGASCVLDKYDKENVIKMLYLLRHMQKPKSKAKISYVKLREAWIQIDHMKLVII